MLYGGKRRPDLGALFFEPTILVDVDHTMKVMTEETFGPIVPIMRVRDADEAIRLANDSEYGLSASIYTRDLKRGEQLARRIEAGDVAINRPLMVFGTPSLPMGGVKNSGVGRRNGTEGLLRFVRTQSILVDTLFGVAAVADVHRPGDDDGVQARCAPCGGSCRSSRTSFLNRRNAQRQHPTIEEVRFV